MGTTIHRRAKTERSRSRRQLAACLALAIYAPAIAPGQDIGESIRANRVPVRAAQDAKALATFIEGVTPNDGLIEVKLGHGKILILKENLAEGSTIAVGDPALVDFILVSPRQLRLVGSRLGNTDISVITAQGQVFTFEVHIVADLDLLQSQLRAQFPDADFTLGQVGDHIVVEGQARSSAQVAQIMQLVRSSVTSTVNNASDFRQQNQSAPDGIAVVGGQNAGVANPGNMAGNLNAPGDGAVSQSSQSNDAPIQLLNLLRVPGSQQVLLKVRVAELNRTAFRQIGADILGFDPKNGSIFGTQLNNTGVASGAVGNLGAFNTPLPITRGTKLSGAAVLNSVESTTAFGIFQKGNFEVLLNALRRNSVLKILAEPNLMALNGHKASFLAGGEFPIPVPQVGATGVASTITVNFKKFGVQLDFLPVILDGDVIRLTVDPEVSSIDFSIGTTLVAGGSPVPGLNTRQAHTTVELKPGQTLAIAGLMQLTLDGQTARIPVLGDLPILGPFFSNTTSNRIEKELVVLVTPYLVEPIEPNDLPPLPGDEVGAPNDLEFYLLGRIEGRTGRDFRATTDGADPLRIAKHLKLERKYVRGPVGFSD